MDKANDDNSLRDSNISDVKNPLLEHEMGIWTLYALTLYKIFKKPTRNVKVETVMSNGNKMIVVLSLSLMGAHFLANTLALPQRVSPSCIREFKRSCHITTQALSQHIDTARQSIPQASELRQFLNELICQLSSRLRHNLLL